MERSRMKIRIASILILSSLTLGCDFREMFYGFEKIQAEQEEKEAQAIRDREKKKNEGKAALDSVEEGVDRSEGNYKLVFTGGEAENMSKALDAPNRTPALLAGGLTAHEYVKYKVGSEIAPTPAKSEYELSAVLTGYDLSGTLKMTRTIGPNPYTVVTDTDTGETSVEKNPKPDPAIVVKWNGTVAGKVDSRDGSIEGTVKGTVTNNEGLSKEFSWKFTGEKAK